MKTLYPEISPYNHFKLKVDEIHELYVEECGNPKGKPVVFLHGGPGGGCTEKHRRYLNPQKYRIVLFDQRGCGRSTPHAELKNNTTWDLVADIEKIREYLKIEKWQVFGGSWGSTLALAYAETHPSRCTELVLRGIFMCRKEEIQWFYQEGASFIFPDEWQKYLKPIPVNERKDLVQAFYKRLTSDDSKIRLEAAHAWAGWEGNTLRLIPPIDEQHDFSADQTAVAIARIECHYFINHAFFKSDDQLLQEAHKIQHIPTVIVHGRYDVVCPVKNAFDLHQVLPKAKFIVVPDAGHAADEPGIMNALVSATDDF